MTFDATTPAGIRALERLATEKIGWLTTVTPDGQPQASAIWFLWEDGELLIYSHKRAPRNGNIEDNPKGLEFSEIEAAQLPRSLADVDAAVINGNYAIEADLSPAEDAIAADSAEGNPYANLLVVRAEDEGDAALATLAELLQSPEVASFIEENYGGAVVPAR